jgi:hypothetical protein
VDPDNYFADPDPIFQFDVDSDLAQPQLALPEESYLVGTFHTDVISEPDMDPNFNFGLNSHLDPTSNLDVDPDPVKQCGSMLIRIPERMAYGTSQ